MFVLPDAVSASIAGVQLKEVGLCVTHFCTNSNETLKIILSEKSHFAFL